MDNDFPEGMYTRRVQHVFELSNGVGHKNTATAAQPRDTKHSYSCNSALITFFRCRSTVTVASRPAASGGTDFGAVTSR